MGGVRKKLTPRRQRMYIIIASMLLLSLAAFLTLSNLKDNIVFFRTPTDITTKPPKADQEFKLGGLVKKGTFKQNPAGDYEFVITDMETEMKVTYTGMLPALFREGQGVIATGKMDVDKTFKAREILAKHDEKYMPKEVYEEIKKRGYLEK